ncbi:MAG: FAD/NAD(P)-binding protein [Aurantimonas endophytica]|uniref:FAD/NAD(P)-binding protein n=1 Tax=Aurantimonas endophytica TaxID=1522175 RepID=UPI0030010281
MTPERILIVGGGASGVILAAHLLRDGDARLEVSIVERRPTIGAGVAYGTEERDHLLNTRAGGMSAFPDDPDHFWRWLTESGHAARLGCADRFCFVPRPVYREYLTSLVAPWMDDGRLRVIQGDCVDLVAFKGGVSATLADGRTEIAGLVVLATGHAVPEYDDTTPYSGPWCSREELGIGPDDAVVIIGTGLSMADNVALLRAAGHRGRIIAVSRRGLLPQVHAPSEPLKLDPADIPFGTSVTYLLRWLRRTVRWAEAEGSDWRDVIDALRPHTQALWQSLSVDSKRRFLRHARTFWEVHRHRLAPQAAASLQVALAEDHLQILAGRLEEACREGGRIAIRIRRRGGDAVALDADRLIDCTGILRDPTDGSGRLVGRMIDRGAARLDPLLVGIDVDKHCAIVGADGISSQRLYAVGPVTRARFWEITAIPDIRAQCAALARTLRDRRETLAPTSS